MFDGGAAAVGAEDVARHRDELRALGALTARSSLDSVNINLTQNPIKIRYTYRDGTYFVLGLDCNVVALGFGRLGASALGSHSYAKILPIL